MSKQSTDAFFGGSRSAFSVFIYSSIPWLVSDDERFYSFVRTDRCGSSWIVTAVAHRVRKRSSFGKRSSKVIFIIIVFAIVAIVIIVDIIIDFAWRGSWSLHFVPYTMSLVLFSMGKIQISHVWILLSVSVTELAPPIHTSGLLGICTVYTSQYIWRYCCGGSCPACRDPRTNVRHKDVTCEDGGC